MNSQEALTYLEQYQATLVNKDSNLDKALTTAIKALKIVGKHTVHNCKYSIEKEANCFCCRAKFGISVSNIDCDKCNLWQADMEKE